MKIPQSKLNLIKKNSHAENNRNNNPIIPIVEQGEGIHLAIKLNLIYNYDLSYPHELVQLCNIKGTLYHYDKIDSDFKPKRLYVNKRFRKVWKWIQTNINNNENIIFPTDILLLKLTDEDYFVIEGLRRVICLKHSKIKVITALVLDYQKSIQN